MGIKKLIRNMRLMQEKDKEIESRKEYAKHEYDKREALDAQLAEKDKDIEMLKAEVKNAWAERNLVVERVRELEAKLKPQIDNGDEERRLLREEAEDRKGE